MHNIIMVCIVGIIQISKCCCILCRYEEEERERDILVEKKRKEEKMREEEELRDKLLKNVQQLEQRRLEVQRELSLRTLPASGKQPK